MTSTPKSLQVVCHGRFLRKPEFESEERVPPAVLEFDKIAVDAGKGDRAHDADRAEIVLGDRANDIYPVALFESLHHAALDSASLPAALYSGAGGFGDIGLEHSENPAALCAIPQVSLFVVVELNSSLNGAEEL